MLLVVGLASIMSLFLLEPGFVILFIQLSVMFALFAWVGLMLPLNGIRKKITLAACWLNAAWNFYCGDGRHGAGAEGYRVFLVTASAGSAAPRIVRRDAY